MCLIALALRQHPRYELILIANRDELLARPAAQAAFWTDAPEVLAGRDLEKGGTWLGVTRTGKFAAITNFRDPSRQRADARSRGEVVARFLREPWSPENFLRELQSGSAAYNDFSLLLGSITGAGAGLAYFSTVEKSWRTLGPGLYGLSNHLLDTPWPKVERAKARLAEILALPGEDPPITELFGLLREDAVAPDDRLPATGVGLEHERGLSPIFIRGERYGTRCSTVVALSQAAGGGGEGLFVERTFDRTFDRTFERAFKPAPKPTPEGIAGPDGFREVAYRFKLGG